MIRKTCTKCGGDFPATVEYFHRNTDHGKKGLYSRCKTCKNKYNKKWKKDNPNWQKNNKLQKKYNISFEDMNNLLDEQNNKCKICGREFNGIESCVDHNHKTGKVRGMLCHACNMGIGYLKEDKNILKNAIKYLESDRND